MFHWLSLWELQVALCLCRTGTAISFFFLTLGGYSAHRLWDGLGSIYSRCSIFTLADYDADYICASRIMCRHGGDVLVARMRPVSFHVLLKRQRFDLFTSATYANPHGNGSLLSVRPQITFFGNKPLAEALPCTKQAKLFPPYFISTFMKVGFIFVLSGNKYNYVNYRYNVTIIPYFCSCFEKNWVLTS